jgi:hypothetical protein
VVFARSCDLARGAFAVTPRARPNRRPAAGGAIHWALLSKHRGAGGGLQYARSKHRATTSGRAGASETYGPPILEVGGAIEWLSRWLTKQYVTGRVRGHRPLVITFRAHERHDSFLGMNFNRQRPATRLPACRTRHTGRRHLLLFHFDLPLGTSGVGQQQSTTAELAGW